LRRWLERSWSGLWPAPGEATGSGTRSVALQFFDAGAEFADRLTEFVELGAHPSKFLGDGSAGFRGSAKPVGHPLALAGQALGEFGQACRAQVFQGELEMMHPTLEPLTEPGRRRGLTRTLRVGTADAGAERTVTLTFDLAKPLLEFGGFALTSFILQSLDPGTHGGAARLGWSGAGAFDRLGLELVGLAHHSQGLVVTAGGLELARLILKTLDAFAPLRGRLGVGVGDGGDHPGRGGRQA
jgi:hypothetical protein